MMNNVIRSCAVPATVTRSPPQTQPAGVKPAVPTSGIAAGVTTASKPPPPRLSGTRARPSASSNDIPRSLGVMVCNAMDDVINSFIDPPALRPTVDPQRVFDGNFAPVPGELPPTPCPVVEGTIPECLAGGAYIRNGPNPQHLPRGTHHLFDGDGMLHSLLLHQDRPILSSRFVHTYKYLIERDAGEVVVPSVFSGFHGIAGVARGAVTAARVLSGQLNPLSGVGQANTSLAFFGGRLFALGESDLPYHLRLDPSTGDISTVGRHDFDGELFMSMTAHPKKDPVTGEVFAFRYSPMPPFLSYFRFDSDGNKTPDVPIFSVRQPSFMHDFAVTENYAVFFDIQIVMNPANMLLGNGAPVGFDAGKVPRVGVLPKYAADGAAMRWFDTPGFNPMHALNAWEDAGGEELVIIAPNVLSVEHALERIELTHSSVEMVRINLASGEVSRTPLSAALLDFGVINPGYVGRRNRYGYFGIGCPMPSVSGVAKLDLALAGKGECVLARRDFGEGCFAGEPFFVPEEDGAGAGKEDDGYVVCYVHDERSGESRFVVMDARSPELEVVAQVLLPQRVPSGFHGIFLTRRELLAQR